MGWTQLHRKKGLSHQAFFEAEFPYALGQHGRVLDSATVRTDGEQAWVAAVKGSQTDPDEVWLLVVLFNWIPRAALNFIYKDMCDSMGPNGVPCPDRLLDLLTPTTNEYANEYRAGARQANAAQAAKPKVRPGDVVVFERPWKFANGAEIDRLTFHKRNTFNNGTYRLPSNWRALPFTVEKAA